MSQQHLSAYNRFTVDRDFFPTKLEVLNPATNQKEKNQNSQPFGRENRKNPFPVKPEHATVCGYL